MTPRTVEEAERIQERLRHQVDLTSGLSGMPVTVTGLDVSYDKESSRVAAAAVVVDVATLDVRESAVVFGEAGFPYVPGLLAFREVPILLEALGTLASRPEVLVCDGYGVAHPRGFGLACHMGVVAGLPTFGVAKTPFVATGVPPGPRRGDWSPLSDAGAVVGRALRTRTNVKPVFVTVGHRISLAEATALTLALSRRYRIPEATRKADSLSRAALRGRG